MCRSFTGDRQFNIQSVLGKGVWLIDFGRAIDTHVFPEETMFVGSCETETFQCPAMLEGQPWKWQVCVHASADRLKKRACNSCIPSEILNCDCNYLVTLAGLASMFTVDTATIFRHGLNFVRCTVTSPLL